jgi:hypothetical protein
MRRTLRQLKTLAMLALIVAGCSNASAGSGSRGGDGMAATAGNGAAHEKAVAFAQCMRANGIRAFPDPRASGEVTIDGIANDSSVDTSSAAFTRALNACKDLEPAGFTGR